MTAPAIEMAYPLRWPAGRPRTAPGQCKSALWHHEGRPITLSVARARLREQVRAMTRPGHGWRVTGMILSTNIRFTASDARDRNVSRAEPADIGVAFYFDFDGRPHALACDRWDTVQDNIAALAAHIEALRGQERWGVADLRQAFAGYVALPAPAGTPAMENWWQVLGITHDATLTQINAAWRDKMRFAHADAGGSHEAAVRLNLARDAGVRAQGGN